MLEVIIFWSFERFELDRKSLLPNAASEVSGSGIVRNESNLYDRDFTFCTNDMLFGKLWMDGISKIQSWFPLASINATLPFLPMPYQ